MIAFRCDASAALGLGHVVRCLELARQLRPHDQVVFGCTSDPANNLIQDHGYLTFHRSPGEHEEPYLIRLVSELSPRVLLVDTTYPYSSSLIRQARRIEGRPRTMMVLIGNACEGLGECDLAVFPSAHEDERLLKRYLTDEQFGAALMGIRYVIVRREIKEAKTGTLGASPTRPRLVVTTGGSDPKGVMIRLISQMASLNLEADVRFLTGSSFAHLRELERLRPGLPDRFSLRPYSLHELVSADAVVCTFGVSMYEMMYLQVPTVCVSHTEENAWYAAVLHERYPVFVDLGFIDDVPVEGLRGALEEVLSQRFLGIPLASDGTRIVDGNGAGRIAQEIVGRLTVGPWTMC